MIELKLTPQKPALLQGYDNEFHVLLQITADPNVRVPDRSKSLNLSLVIDRSGSMAGQPLYEAKSAASMMIECMTPNDRISVVTYDSKAEVVVPSTFCSNKSDIIRAIQQIRDGGTTALHEGWLLGAEQIARFKSGKSINRVLLLSDGNANVGLCDSGQIRAQCERLADTGISTSTYGLGLNFNEDLMISMASGGLGQGYYGETAQDLADPFNEEFELLLNTIATNLTLTAETPNHVSLELKNDFRSSEKGWLMPDLAYGGELWALFRLRIDKQKLHDGNAEVLRCNLSFKDREGKKHVEGPVILHLSSVPSSTFSTYADDEKVQQRLGELLVAYFQRQAGAAAQVGDWDRVAMIMQDAKDASHGNEWVKRSLNELDKYAHMRQRDQFRKEALYSADRMNKRMVSSDELNVDYNVDFEAQKLAYLRRKTERGKRM